MKFARAIYSLHILVGCDSLIVFAYPLFFYIPPRVVAADQREEKFDIFKNCLLFNLIGFEDSAITTFSSSRFLVTSVLAPIKQFFPIATLWPTVAFTAKKLLAPICTLPEILHDEVSQQ